MDKENNIENMNDNKNTENTEPVSPDDTAPPESGDDNEGNTPPVDPTEPPTENLDEPPIEPEEPDEPEEPEKPLPYYTQIPDFYDRVRLNLSASSINISDEIIDYPENAPMAEMRMKQRVPNWKELEEFKLSLFQTCIVYMTCYQLCYIANSNKITEQTTPSLTLKYSQNADMQKPCERFLVLIDDLVAEINDEKLNGFFGFKITESNHNCCQPRCRFF